MLLLLFFPIIIITNINWSWYLADRICSKIQSVLIPHVSQKSCIYFPRLRPTNNSLIIDPSLENTVAPLSPSTRLPTVGIKCLSLWMALFGILMSMHGRTLLDWLSKVRSREWDLLPFQLCLVFLASLSSIETFFFMWNGILHADIERLYQLFSFYFVVFQLSNALKYLEIFFCQLVKG